MACAVSLLGCGSRTDTRPPATVEVASLPQLSPGQAFHFADHFKGEGLYADLLTGGDGHARITLAGARQPVICAPAPYILKLKGRLPDGAELRTAFGLAPESRNKPGRVRFSIRLRTPTGTMELLSEELTHWLGPDTRNWSPVTVGLPHAGGEDVEIELATEIVGGPRSGEHEDNSAAYAVWVHPTLIVPAEGPRPNIVLVVVDALRADRLGCYGYHRETSPFLDRLSREGVVFEDATSQATGTLPSVLSMLTSSYPLIRGSMMQEPSAGADRDPELPLYPVAMPASLQRSLGESGYSTAASVGGGFVRPELGFDAGFDWYWFPGQAPELANQLAELKQALTEHTRTPFFLLLHTYEVHDYFQGRGHYLAQFDEGYLGPLRDPERLAEAVFGPEPGELTAADLQYVVDLYDGEIRHADYYLGLLLEWLLETPWGKNTIVVITADHGEAFREHGRMSHGWTPHRELSHVPLIIRFPDGRGRGRRVREPVGLVDLAPTLLEGAGVAPPSGFVGRSLLPLIDGNSNGVTHPVLAESTKHGLLAREGNWSYIISRSAQTEELYNLAEDPDQAEDLARARPDQLRHMRRVLAELTMNARSGHRLVVAGDRAEPVVVELRCEGTFGYLDVPTLPTEFHLDEPKTTAAADDPLKSGGSGEQRAVVQLPAGKDPHVILFSARELETTVTVSATIGGRPVEADRFHLGKSQIRPGAVPIAVRGKPDPRFVADEPPLPEDPESWGIWIWIPTIAEPVQRKQTGTLGEMPPGMRDQLQALGYLR